MVEGILGIAQSYAYDVIIGIVLLLVGFGVGILVKKILQRVLKEMKLNSVMAKVNVTYDLEKWISSIASYIIYLVTIVIFLDNLGLGSVVLYLVVGAILMLIILTSLVGLKDVIPNFIAWLLIQKRGNVQEGRNIDIKEISGHVEKIGYLETEIKTERGDILYVPNSLFLKSKFKVKKAD
jgi:small conductance mechanosensitive channel